MAFVFEMLTHAWGAATRDADRKDLENWQGFLDATERDRQREYVIFVHSLRKTIEASAMFATPAPSPS